MSGTGTVWLVGAGPGDPGLLTLRAARLLRRADIVVHDALVGERVLARISPRAERIDVGKRAGRPHYSQTAIGEILVEAAGRARTVVRLKGGDPFVFGRGGEEVEALAHAGVRYRVVPGVTAAIGAAASAAIPLTHRDHASAVTFVTGQEDPDRASRVDWSALAQLHGTLAIYMGVRRLREIACRLLAGGRAQDTPAAIIENATEPNQRIITAPLCGIADAAERAAVQSPAILLIGDVVALQPSRFRPLE